MRTKRLQSAAPAKKALLAFIVYLDYNSSNKLSLKIISNILI